MTLDRGTLAKIDRQVLSALDHGQDMRLVKVPLSEAVWSTWRRYCDALGVTMGAGIAGLIAHELGALVNQDEHHGAVFAPEMQSELVARSAGPRRPRTPPRRAREVAPGVRASLAGTNQAA